MRVSDFIYDSFGVLATVDERPNFRNFEVLLTFTIY
jgi:hypothetical protein